MSTGSIYILGENQNLAVSSDKIYSSGGSSGSTLHIPFKIEFRNVEKNRGRILSRADIISIKAELKIADIACGENVVLGTYRIIANSIFEHQVQFILSDELLAKVEKQRKGNMPVQLLVTIQAGVYEDIQFSNNQTQSFITAIETGSGFVSFEIPQSTWVRNILPNLGHKSFRLIELPAANDIIPTEYKKSLDELEEAKKYFVNGDYDKTVAHCRSALDPFKAKQGELKSFVKSKSEFSWASDVMDATDVWLNELVKKTSHFTSKAHHIPSVGHFGRRDAEIIMMVTTSIIAYIGKIEAKAE